MTSAPADLLNVRNFLKQKTGLPFTSLGIVGDVDHNGGYHCGSDRVSSSDYSVRESSRDVRGLSTYASALDVGAFTAGGVTLASFSMALVKAAVAGDPRMSAVREIIYTPDGSRVKRFDRLNVRSTGDSSHLAHTHISFFRDSFGSRDSSSSFFGVVREIFETGNVSTIGGSDKMAGFLQVEGTPEIFFTADGTSSVHVAAESLIPDMVLLSREGIYPTIGFNGNVRRVGPRALIPPIVGPVPAGWEDRAASPAVSVDITDEAVSVLADRVALALGMTEVKGAVKDAISDLRVSFVS